MAEAIQESYKLVRLSSSKHGETLEKPDDTIGSISHIISIAPMNDGSWEMLVMKDYLAILRSKLGNKYQNFVLDVEYDPFEPTKDDVDYWGLDTARALCFEWFVDRARKRMSEPWLIAKVYYAYLLEVKLRGMQ